jgi:hypothetical protein
MPTIEDLMEAIKREKSFGANNGACFGTFDPSRRRPIVDHHIPSAEATKGPTRRIVMVDDGTGNMVPDDQLPEKK